MNVICFLHWSLCVWRVASLNHLVTLKFEKWTLVPFLIFGRTSCSNCSTSTISCHASSCREVVTSHATCIRQYYRYRWWLKDQNDELFQVYFLPQGPTSRKMVVHDNIESLTVLLFFRHTAYFLVAGDELKNQNQHIPCKHAAAKKDDSWFIKLFQFSLIYCLYP